MKIIRDSKGLIVETIFTDKELESPDLIKSWENIMNNEIKSKQENCRNICDTTTKISENIFKMFDDMYSNYQQNSNKTNFENLPFNK